MLVKRKIAIVILAAGKGTRMGSKLPKVLYKVAGRTLIQYLIETAEKLNPEHIIVVVAPGMDSTPLTELPHTTVVQHQQLGTGNAVSVTREILGSFHGDVLILYGDTPLVTRSTLENMLSLAQRTNYVIVSLGFRLENTGSYGRLVVEGNQLTAIVECRDVMPGQTATNLCNAGAMLVRSPDLFGFLEQTKKNNLSGEYYLTDIVSTAVKSGLYCTYVEGEESELHGVNTQHDLALVESCMQKRLRSNMLNAGVTLVDPETVYFCFDTKIGNDVIIDPYVVIGPGVVIGDRVRVFSFCHLEQTNIASGALIGPYARLRPGSIVCDDVHIGNFVEVKSSTIESCAKVNHFSYIGDGRVGKKANIGAGTIFCNYDGKRKSFTDVGNEAFIGSNSALVAPVKIGDGAVIGAGSVITRDVSANALALARGKQREVANWTQGITLNRKQKRS